MSEAHHKILFWSDGLAYAYSPAGQCNHVLSADDAELNACRTLNPDSPYYVLRYTDGTYAWSAITARLTPGSAEAELVREGRTPPRRPRREVQPNG